MSDAPRNPELDKAELTKLQLEAKKLQLDVERSEMHLADQRREARMEAAISSRNRVMYVGTMSDVANRNHEATLTLWHRESPGEPITLIIDSPGGSVISGLALCDRILELRAAGTPVHTEVRGMAASMAGVLSQVGETRTMSKNSLIMIHEAATGAMGKASEIEDTVVLIKRLQEKLLAILSERSNLTPAQIKKRWLRRDWWIDSTEALALGLVDSVL